METLFLASIGHWDFDVFEQAVFFIRPEYGFYFLLVFLIVNLILLLNLVIAIMSDTYVVFKNKSQ